MELLPGRVCSECHRHYNRSNRFRMWTWKVEHGRMYYTKCEVKLCTRCLSSKEASRVLHVADLSMSTIKESSVQSKRAYKIPEGNGKLKAVG